MRGLRGDNERLGGQWSGCLELWREGGSTGDDHESGQEGRDQRIRTIVVLKFSHSYQETLGKDGMHLKRDS